MAFGRGRRFAVLFCTFAVLSFGCDDDADVVGGDGSMPITDGGGGMGGGAGGTGGTNPEIRCGDSILDIGEECDDGNNTDGDGCSSSCELEGSGVCGDGQASGDEECDDGNTDDGDGCSSACTIEVPGDPECGNGLSEAGEECDDGNTDDGDGCSADCEIEVPPEAGCGNGILEDGEGCEDGNTDDGDGCDNACQVEGPMEAVCGDGIATPPETCDDGNTNDGDGCAADCTIEPVAVAECGNSTIETGETCDDGNTDAGDGCDENCQTEDPVCGNGTLEPGEQCDDGNTDNGDGCDAECANEPNPNCGNGDLDDGEQCDDGNTDAGDGCDADCQLEINAECGNGIVELGETCDDGNTDAGDGCSAICQTEDEVLCGNGDLDDGEQCDDGNTDVGDGCDADCQLEINAVCGNSIVELGETCDDGNTDAGDGCSAICQTEDVLCGNGVVDDGETCDDGNTDAGDGCDADCQTEVPDPVCGNFLLEEGEECDDGNTDAGDGCDAECANEEPVEGCGDGFIVFPETCDDGNTDNGDGCSSACMIEFAPGECGDGTLHLGETCDDGNTDAGDGCDANCQREAGECGDGTLNIDEQCDDGNIDAGDGCDAACQIEIPVCGDGRINLAEEECDDGNNDDADGCSAACLVEGVDLTPPEGNGDHPNAIQQGSFDRYTLTLDDFYECTFATGDGMGACPAATDTQMTMSVIDADGTRAQVAFNDDFGGTFCSQISTQFGPGDYELIVNEFGNNAPIETYVLTANCVVAEASVCGNGVAERLEECDDGNLENGDGCDDTCVSECGNGNVDGGEQCDDGNREDGDGCNAICGIEGCGNGILEPDLDEECDDANADAGDGCDAACLVEAVDVSAGGDFEGGFQEGSFDRYTATLAEPTTVTFTTSDGMGGCPEDTVLTVFRVEEDGTLTEVATNDDIGNGNACSSVTTALPAGEYVIIVRGFAVNFFNPAGRAIDAYTLTAGYEVVACGDGTVAEPLEQCDDGNTDNGDGCDEACQLEAGCGNGQIDDGEACDDGNTDPDDGCDAACQLECGNGNVDGGETCDDGNVEPNDGCSAECQLEECGNGIVEGDETCDDGNLDPNDGCDADCVLECGNGNVEGDEQCDDGNQDAGDGCGPECLLEGCGNGIAEPDLDEECDDMNEDADDGCDSCAIESVDISPPSNVYDGAFQQNSFDRYTFTIDEEMQVELFTGDGMGGCPGDTIVTVFSVDDMGELVQVARNDDIARGQICSNVTALFPAGDYVVIVNGFSDRAIDAYALTVNYTAAACGDGVMVVGEDCDDGNMDDGDGCNADCTLGNLVEVANSVGDLTQLLAAVDAAGLTDGLSDAESAFTVFAPNDAAFAALEAANPGMMAALLADIPTLTAILNYHLVEGANLSPAVAAAASFTTVNGQDLFVTVDNDTISINGTELVVVDVLASNGVIHVLSGVLVPPVCGNGTLESGEQCDDGNLDVDDGCDAVCAFEQECGNGVVEGTEICDDGNLDAGDGCDSVCTEEAFAIITGEYHNPDQAFGENEKDTYSFTADDNVFIATGTNDGGAGCPGDTVIEIYSVDDMGTRVQVARNDDGGARPCSLVQAGLPAGNYELDVLGFQDGSVVGYNLDFFMATGISDGGDFDGMTVEEGDDHYLLDLDADTALTVFASDGAGDCPAEMQMAIYDEDRVLIQEAENDGPGLCPQLTFMPLEAGRYFFYVSGAAGIAVPAYTLTVEFPGSTCGDGNVEPGEACDDGNVVDGDGCDSTCQVEPEPVCGDGNIDDGETCDDGNTDAGDGCDDQCQIELDPACGDGNVDDGEQCDDGNLINDDGCDDQCQIEGPFCGDGNVDDGEECDDGNGENADGCDEFCTMESYAIDMVPYVKTDSAVASDEEDVYTFTAPEDGRITARTGPDPCPGDTQITVYRLDDMGVRGQVLFDDDDGPGPCSLLEAEAIVAGDYEIVVNPLRASVVGYQLDFNYVANMCGDGSVGGAEECDDGNTDAGDGCDADCQIEGPFCGDGNVDDGEECDDGNGDNEDGCDELCTFETYEIDQVPYVKTGSSVVNGQEDVYTFTAPSDGSFTAMTGPNPCPGDTLIVVYAIDDMGVRAQVARHDDIAGADNRCSLIEDQDIAAGNYEIVVTNFGDMVENYQLDFNFVAALPPVCGDGEVTGDEECDDGNVDNGDGCSDVCASECGNGNVDGDEQCDDGNTDAGDGCDAECQVETNCGDGVMEGAEECDDGNGDNGDGCDEFCTMESYAIEMAPYVKTGSAIASNEEDIYTFTAPTDGRITVRTGPVPCPGDTQVTVYLLDDMGERVQVLFDDDDGPGLCSELEAEEIVAGDYEIVVNPFRDPVVDYQLDFNYVGAGAACGDGNVDDGEECDDGNTDNGDGCDETCNNEVVALGSDLVITEVMQNPAIVSDARGEWFEVHNAGDEAIDLMGWTFTDERANPDITTVDISIVIEPGGYAVLGRFADTNINGNVEMDYQYRGDMLHANGADKIVALDPMGNEVDRVEWDNGQEWPDPTGNGYSMQFDPALDALIDDNNVGANWCRPSSSYSPGAFGTPGADNDPCPDGVAECGNGALDMGEDCDDGNVMPGDGCDANCQVEPFCGDGNVDAGETCDDGNINNGDGCDANCQTEAACGNGVVDDGETCDDGNVDNGDGCDSVCSEELFDIVVGQIQMTDSVGDGAADVYTFRVDDPNTLLLTETLGPNGGCVGDTMLELYLDGNLVDSNDDSMGNPPCSQIIQQNLPAGDYELHVIGDGADVDGYVLSFFLFVNANGGGDFQGQISPGGNDIYGFQLIGPTDVTMGTDDGANCRQPVDTFLTLYSVDVVTGDLTEVDSDDDAGPGFCSLLQVDALPPGNYVAIVTGFQNRAIPPYTFSLDLQ